MTCKQWAVHSNATVVAWTKPQSKHYSNKKPWQFISDLTVWKRWMLRIQSVSMWHHLVGKQEPIIWRITCKPKTSVSFISSMVNWGIYHPPQWVKRPEHGINHPPSSSAQVKERVSYTCIPVLPLRAFMACFRVNFTLSFLYITHQICLINWKNTPVLCYSSCSHKELAIFLIRLKTHALWKGKELALYMGLYKFKRQSAPNCKQTSVCPNKFSGVQSLYWLN